VSRRLFTIWACPDRFRLKTKNRRASLASNANAVRRFCNPLQHLRALSAGVAMVPRESSGEDAGGSPLRTCFGHLLWPKGVRGRDRCLSFDPERGHSRPLWRRTVPPPGRSIGGPPPPGSTTDNPCQRRSARGGAYGPPRIPLPPPPPPRPLCAQAGHGGRIPPLTPKMVWTKSRPAPPFSKPRVRGNAPSGRDGRRPVVSHSHSKRVPPALAPSLAMKRSIWGECVCRRSGPLCAPHRAAPNSISQSL